MAVTKIWPIKDSIGRVLEYAKNPDKTVFSDLISTLHYAGNKEKTVMGEEKTMFVTGVNCTAETAVQEMVAVQERFDKTTGNVAYHAYQSFKPGEVTPELCHKLGVELARRMWGEGYQVLVATHFNTGTYHNHLVINAVSLWDGKKFDCSKRAYYQLRKISDELCLDHGLSVIKSPSGKTPRKIYFAEKNGEPTRYNLMREAIDEALSMSTTPKVFISVMRKMGYVVDLDPAHKYATIRSIYSEKSTRLYRLGESYDRDRLLTCIQENLLDRYVETYVKYRQFISGGPQMTTIRPRKIWIKGALRSAKKITGLRAQYLHYCYLLGHLPKNTKRRPLSPEAREACRRLDRYTAQITLITRNHLQGIPAVEDFIRTTDNELKLVAHYRSSLQRQLRSCHDPEEKRVLTVKRDDCTRLLSRLRKDKKTAQSILTDQPKMRETIQIEQQMKWEQHAPKKQRKRDHER